MGYCGNRAEIERWANRVHGDSTGTWIRKYGAVRDFRAGADRPLISPCCRGRELFTRLTNGWRMPAPGKVRRGSPRDRRRLPINAHFWRGKLR